LRNLGTVLLLLLVVVVAAVVVIVIVVECEHEATRLALNGVVKDFLKKGGS
jgi:hypothetical protein